MHIVSGENESSRLFITSSQTCSLFNHLKTLEQLAWAWENPIDYWGKNMVSIYHLLFYIDMAQLVFIHERASERTNHIYMRHLARCVM